MRTQVRPRVARPIGSAVALAVLCFSGGAPAQSEAEPAPPRGSGAVPSGPGGAIVKPPAEQEQPAKPPVVVMPKLTHFEHAPYPPEAVAAQIEGLVVLSMDIDAAGTVTSATVLEPAGHGFDEAARAAALKFRFEPATADGKPIPVRIKFPYRFTLTPAETPPPPPRVGNLSGRVRMGVDDAPLAGADVVVRSSDGQEQHIKTDEQGNWTLEGLPPGKYSVHLEVEGFQPVDVVEEVGAGEVTEPTYRLVPVVSAEGYEIVVRGERPPREVTRRVLDRREISRMPGTSGDALRSIESLPGVARPPGLIGFIIVRGSAPEDTEVFIDGSTVPLIYHFGGLTTAVPTEMLDRYDFYPGNFSTRYGRVTGGIVDVALRSPNTECYGDYGVPTGKEGCFHGFAQVDLIDTRAIVQGPIGDHWSFAVAGRRSWIDTWLKPALEAGGSSVTSAPVYYDYQLIANAEPSDDSELSLRFFGSDDRFEILITDPAAQDPGIFGGNIRLATAFYRAQALYRAELSDRVDLTAMVSGGWNGTEFSIGQIKFDLALYPINIRSEIDIEVTDYLEINLGQDILIAPFDVLVRAPTPPRPGEPDPGPFSARRLFETRDSGTGYRPAWYAEAEFKPTKRVLLVPGLRIDYARDSGHADFSPRITGRYDLIGGPAAGAEEERPRRTTLKGGVGVFQQPPQFQETDEVFGTPGIESNYSVHYAVGVEQEITRQVELGVEGYYKDLDNLVSRQTSIDGAFVYGNAGVGHVIGLETMLKYKPDERFFGWLAYTISRSVRQDSPDAEERLFEFDQTHNLTMLGSYRLGRGWEAGARFRVISGGLTTPVLRPPALPSIYSSDSASYAPLQGAPFSERLPLFHQLDVRIEKAWQYKDWRLSVFLDVQNAYNNPAVEGIAYNYNFTNGVFATGLPILPSLGVRGEF